MWGKPINRAQRVLRYIRLRSAVDSGNWIPSASFVEAEHCAGPPTPIRGDHVEDDNAWAD